MNKITKGAVMGIALLILTGLLLTWMLPGIVAALPGQVRGRLPQELLRAVTTPLPAALPAPEVTPAPMELTFDDLELVDLVTPVVTEMATRKSKGDAPTGSTPHVSKVNRDTPTPKPTSTSTPIATEIPLPAAVLLQGMQITPQKLNNCGPANLSVNLNYYGLELTQFDVAKVVKPHYDDRNVSPEELVDYVNQNTELRAALYRGGDLPLLKRLIAAGFPVVIEKGYEPDDWQGWMGHYLTLFGYDNAQESFITVDTFLGPWDSSGRFYNYEEIQSKWEHFNFAFYVVYQSEQERDLQEITGPTLNNAEEMWKAAVQRAQQRVEIEPQNSFAWFNLGSGLSQLAGVTGEGRYYRAAATAFDQARFVGLPPRMLWYQFQLYEAYLATGRYDDILTLTATILENSGGQDIEETFLYRGHALQAQGDMAGATAAYRRALELNPHYQDAREALDL